MKFYKHVRSLFKIQLANRALAFRITAARRPRIAVIALFCLAAVLVVGVLCSAGLIHRYHLRLRPSSSNVELAAGSQAGTPARRAGLSRKRKGFDDAIAVLRTAANQNQQLAGYYKGVAKRTGRQEAEVKTATSAQEPVNNQKSPSSTELSGIASAAGSAPNRSEPDGASLVQRRVATAGTAEDS